MVPVEFPAGVGGKPDIDKRFVLLYPFDQNPFDRYFRILIQDFPCSSSMYIVEQNNLRDFFGIFCIQVV